MQPITNNFDLPKPADLNVLSQDNSNAQGSDPFNLPNGITEQTVVKYAKTRNSTWNNWFTPKFNRIKENHKLWRNSQMNVASRVGNSPIPLPIGYSILEAVVARLVTTLMSRPKLVEAVAETVMPDNSGQEDVEDFVNQCLMAELRKPEKGKFAIKSAMLDGYVIARSEWKIEEIEDTQPIFATDPISGQQIQTGEEPITKKKSSWSMRKCNSANCAWDIHVMTKVQDSAWFRERDPMSYNQLLQWQSPIARSFICILGHDGKRQLNFF
jgi:hypothetical protein